MTKTLARLWFTSIISPDLMAIDPIRKEYNSLKATVERLKRRKAEVIDSLETATGPTAEAWNKELVTLNAELERAKPELERLQRLINSRN